MYLHAAMPPPRRDIELVARANAGDTTAHAEIYRHYTDFVFGLALQRLRDRDDAADVLQDAFVRLLSRFPGFELSAGLATFLRAHVEYLCRDRLEQRGITADVDPLEVAGEYAGPEADRGTGAALLASLAPADRELLTLRYGEDLSVPQLSETLGIPAGTIKTRLHRAIATLRDKLTTTERARG